MKKCLATLLTLSLCLGLLVIPAGALTVGQTGRVTAGSSAGSDYRWSSSDPSVVTVTGSGPVATVTAVGPGTATIHVSYTMQKPGLKWNSETKRYDHITTPYEERQAFTIAVAPDDGGGFPGDGETQTMAEPEVSYGKPGDDVSGLIEDIGIVGHGLVPVAYRGLWGFAGTDMRLVIPFQFSKDSFGTYNQVTDAGYIAVRLKGKDGKIYKYVIDTQGRPVFTAPDRGLGVQLASISCSDGPYISYSWMADSNTIGGSGRYDFQGNALSAAQAKSALEKWEDRLARQGVLYYWGSGDTQERWPPSGLPGEGWRFGPPNGDPDTDAPELIIRPSVDGVRAHWTGYAYGNYTLGQAVFAEGLFLVKSTSTQKLGAVDANGDLVIPLEYDWLSRSQGGYLSYKKGGQMGVLKNPVQPPAGQSAPLTGRPSTAIPTNDKLTVNGVRAEPTAYKIEGSNYFKLRDLAALLSGSRGQFSVDYDDTLRSIAITTGQSYDKLPGDLQPAPAGDRQAEPSNNAVYIDGVKVDLTVYKIDGSNYFKLRDLGEKLNFSVDWSQGAGMTIDTK